MTGFATELGLGDEQLSTLAALATEPLVLPDDDQADQWLRRLGVADADRVDVLAARPDPQRDSALWWLLERCHLLLRQRMGTVGPLVRWPPVANQGPHGRFGYVWVFLATVPWVRDYHRVRGVPDEDSWRALSVLANQLDNHRSIYGVGGLHTQDWLTHHFRGAVYPLGRLHFERLTVTKPWPGAPFQPGDQVLGVHIPEGRLTPESCDAAFASATDFFARHFGEEKHRYAVCTSWVLDPQLADYLPADSNIIRFQRRFHLVRAEPPDDSGTVVEFLFKRPLTELAALPQDTTLQRAVVHHIRAGRPWHFRAGWSSL